MVTNPLFYEHPPYIAYPPPPSSFKFCPNPASLPSPNSTPTALFVDLFLWLNGWSLDISCVILLYDIMNRHILSLGTLVSEGPCCVFYAIRRQIYCGLTRQIYYVNTACYKNLLSRMSFLFKNCSLVEVIYLLNIRLY